MILKRLIVALIAFGLAPALTSCASTIADTWPHWAGGEPAGTPPRRGSPGYDQFVTHGQPQSNAANPAGAGEQTNSPPAGPAQAYAPVRSARPAPPAPPAADEAPPDPPVTRGGLY